MNEKTFNKVFNAFLLTGMIICVTVACILNLQKPDARVALTILSAVGAIMAAFTPFLNQTGISDSGTLQILDKGLDLCLTPCVSP